jgi:glutaredoxin
MTRNPFVLNQKWLSPAANRRRKQSRDLLKVVLSLLQKSQGLVRGQLSGCKRQGSGVRIVCWSLRGVKPTLKRIVRLDLHDDGPDIQGYLSQLTSQRTVPNIFISEPCILRHIYVVFDADARSPDQKHVGGEGHASLSAVVLLRCVTLTGNDDLQALYKKDGVKALL